MFTIGKEIPVNNVIKHYICFAGIFEMQAGGVLKFLIGHGLHK